MRWILLVALAGSGCVHHYGTVKHVHEHMLGCQVVCTVVSPRTLECECSVPMLRAVPALRARK